jgi:hypothetical protein
MDALFPIQLLAQDQKNPKVTPEDIDRLIAQSTIHSHVFLGRITVVEIELPNGFTVSGRSACVYPENFDAQLGLKFAIENAKESLWAFLGFELAQYRAKQSQPDPSQTIENS